MKTLLFGICALAVFGSASRAQAQSYTITDLGTLGGGTSSASDINNAGQIVGGSANASGTTLPFLYSGGVMQAVGTQAGSALAINDAGLLVGTLSSSVPFYSTGGSVTTIPGFVSATAVNNSGQIVVRASNGFSGAPGNEGTSSIVFGGVVGPALPLAGLAINDSGTIGGFAVPAFNIRAHATIYANGVLTDVSSSFGPPENYITAINNSGRLTGNTQATGAFFAYTVFAGITTRIPSLNTGTTIFQRDLANDVNAGGLVVGSSRLMQLSSMPTHAFLFDGTATFDLNNLIAPGSGWELISASAINDSGSIVGYGTIGGAQHAFLLTPIPEPSTLAACGTLGIGLVTWRLRRRK